MAYPWGSEEHFSGWLETSAQLRGATGVILCYVVTSWVYSLVKTDGSKRDLKVLEIQLNKYYSVFTKRVRKESYIKYKENYNSN